MENKKKKLTGQQGELMRALDISVDDLIANDDGYISDAQRESVPKRQSYQWLQYKILVGAFSSIALIFPILVFLLDDIEPAILLLSLFFISLATFFGSVGIYQYRRLKKDLEANTFPTVQGIAVVNIGESESYLEINGMKLNASPDVLRRVRHLEPYIIHYLPNSKVILSMEHIDDEDNIRQDASRSRLEDEVSDDSSHSDYEQSSQQNQSS